MIHTLTDIELENFGPFVGSHKLPLPETGMCLFKGKVEETGSGSGCGKSFALNTISYVMGGCPYPATELQSWHTEDLPSVKVSWKAGDNLYTATRAKGLGLTGNGLVKGLKGKAAESQLDQIFGLDEKARAVITYRPQGEPGRFLALSDSEKKEYLSKLLDLYKYELVAAEAQKVISTLEKDLGVKKGVLEQLELRGGGDVAPLEQEIESIVSQIEKLKNDQSLLHEKIEQTQNAIVLKQNEYKSAVQENSKALTQILSEIQHQALEISSMAAPMELGVLGDKIQSLQKDLRKMIQEDGVRMSTHNSGKNTIEQSISKIQVELRQKPRLQQEIARLKDEYKKIQAQICPTCEQTWATESSKKKLEDIKVEGKRINDQLKDLLEKESRLGTLQKEAGEYPAFEKNPGIAVAENDILLYKEKETGIRLEFESSKKEKLKVLKEKENLAKADFKAPVDVASIDTALKTLNAIVGTYNTENSNIFNQMSNLERTKIDLVSKVKNIVTNQKEIESIRAKILDTQTKFNFESDLVAMVGRQGFLGGIFEEVLAEISSSANDILGRVANVRHLSIEFQTEKEAQNGNIAARITPVLYSRGNKIGFKAGISGGMKVSVDLAVDLAWGDVISRRRGSYPGWVILDESLYGLSGTDKESCLEMLADSACNKLVLVVDHSSEFQGLFHQVVEIENVDGKARFI